MLYLWNSTHGVWAVHAGGLPHATDTKHADRIKTERRMRFMTNLQKNTCMTQIRFLEFGSFA
jgi:hypothetical protein